MNTFALLCHLIVTVAPCKYQKYGFISQMTEAKPRWVNNMPDPTQLVKGRVKTKFRFYDPKRRALSNTAAVTGFSDTKAFERGHQVPGNTCVSTNAEIPN